MAGITQRNRLLADLEANDLMEIRAHAQEVSLTRGAILSEAGDVMRFLYFPLEGVLSFVGVTESGATVEIADVGNDGVASISALLGARWLPYQVVTKVAGTAVRLPTEVIARQLRECRELHDRLLAAAESVIAQISQSAVCNRYHNARQRLARWLLTTADRAGCLALPFTHEFISSMVGGPRSAVTEASAELRELGAIEYKHGLLSIRDLDRLRDESCECYGAWSRPEAAAAIGGSSSPIGRTTSV